jgi:succinate dehydrogenase / fumarate reductase membrane anchor subunit
MALIRTPLRRARGLGAAKHGVGHFIVQRVTACALLVLVLWAVWSVLSLAHSDYNAASDWLRLPLNAALASLLAFAAFWHMQVGMRVIIEDYFQKAGTKGALLVLNIFICWLAGALTIISILKVAFSPSGGSL